MPRLDPAARRTWVNSYQFQKTRKGLLETTKKGPGYAEAREKVGYELSIWPAAVPPQLPARTVSMSSKDIMRSHVKIEKSTLVTWEHDVPDCADHEGENGNVSADSRG
jgi:hypothetical protein